MVDWARAHTPRQHNSRQHRQPSNRHCGRGVDLRKSGYLITTPGAPTSCALVIADHDTDIIGQPVPPGGIDSTHTDRTLVDNEAVVEAVEYDGGRAKRGQGGTGWDCCAHRIWFADSGLANGPPQSPHDQVVDTIQHSRHHGHRPRIRSLDSIDPDLQSEGTVFFGKTHRMSHYTKILQPIFRIIRPDSAYILICRLDTIGNGYCIGSLDTPVETV